jgi:hypothetical protein
LAVAGLFQMRKSRAQGLALLARAEAAAPERADLVWLHLYACQNDPPCDPQNDEQRLRHLSPDNGAGWLAELTRAVQAQDEAATDAALTAIAHTQRVDLYWTTLIGRLSTAAARTGKISLEEASTEVAGVVAATAIPAYAPASKSCTGDRLQHDDMRDVCRGVARAMEHGDVLITEMIGVAIAKRVWPEDSPEWQAALERRRVYEYRKGLLELLQKDRPSTAQTQEYVALCLQNPSEQAVTRAQIVAAGKDPDPAPG